MMKLAILALCFASALAALTAPMIVKQGLVSSVQTGKGVVNYTRCGGVGTPRQLRISDCEGFCRLVPGTVYNCEMDFMPSTATPSLTLRVEICLNSGFCMQIINTELPNSGVQPGFVYTAKYSLVPNDILSGQTVEFKGYILHTPTQLLDVCVSAEVDILYPIGRR